MSRLSTYRDASHSFVDLTVARGGDITHRPKRKIKAAGCGSVGRRRS
jgi:hypothetical protein